MMVRRYRRVELYLSALHWLPRKSSSPLKYWQFWADVFFPKARYGPIKVLEGTPKNTRTSSAPRIKTHGNIKCCGFHTGKSPGFKMLDQFDSPIVHPGRLAWNLQITHLERKMIFQTSMIMVHVNLHLPGCKSLQSRQEVGHFL